MVADVPQSKQALILLKALSYDANLRPRAGGRLVLGALYTDAATKRRAARMNEEFDGLAARVQGMLLNTSLIEFSTPEALAQAISDQGIDVLYVPSGLDAQILAIRGVARQTHVLSIGAEPGYVSSGLSLGVFTVDGKIQIVLNEAAASASGASFQGEILDLALRVK